METKTERDFRLDFCRGLALIIIFIDHVPGNPVANWTLRNFGFCDAAEVFVLISGISTYLAFGSKLDRLGFSACAKAVARRWSTIYLAHLLLLMGLYAAATLVSRHFLTADYVAFLKLQWFQESPLTGAAFRANAELPSQVSRYPAALPGADGGGALHAGAGQARLAAGAGGLRHNLFGGVVQRRQFHRRQRRPGMVLQPAGLAVPLHDWDGVMPSGADRSGAAAVEPGIALGCAGFHRLRGRCRGAVEPDRDGLLPSAILPVARRQDFFGTAAPGPCGSALLRLRLLRQTASPDAASPSSRRRCYGPDAIRCRSTRWEWC